MDFMLFYLIRLKISIIALFIKIKNRKLSNRYKSIGFSKIVTQRMRKIKWGVSYSVFNGIELLEKSIRSIRDSVDYINVVYSDTSWFGDKTEENILSCLQDLKEKHLIDEIIFYKTNTSKSHYRNEVTKRNLGLKYAKKAKVNYFMTMDTDEFYESDKILKAKRYIINKGITHSYCNIIWYSILPTRRYINQIGCSIQFFCRINRFSKLANHKHNIALVDPTRVLKHQIGAKYFYLQQVEMHHMTYIRKDLIKKFIHVGKRDCYTDICQKYSSFDKNMRPKPFRDPSSKIPSVILSEFFSGLYSNS